jgi:hypothetical protein
MVSSRLRRARDIGETKDRLSWVRIDQKYEIINQLIQIEWSKHGVNEVIPIYNIILPKA